MRSCFPFRLDRIIFQIKADFRLLVGRPGGGGFEPQELQYRVIDLRSDGDAADAEINSLKWLATTCPTGSITRIYWGS